MPFLALEGVRVIETATNVAGAFCAKLLAEYGAEVIKIEPPLSRDNQSIISGDPMHAEQIAFSLHLNTNKKGVTLDLESDLGQDLFKRLIRESDILVESHPPGKLTSMGLGYHELSEVNPNLVMTSVTPFGQTGPHKDYQFTELTVFAASGAMHREGLPERHPLKYGGEIASYFAGTAAVTVTTAASLRAVMSGQGEWIDISIQECMAGHPHQIGRRAPFVYAGELDPRRQPREPAAGVRETYAVGTFRCKDGYFSFLPLGPRMWPNVARMMGRSELLEDPRFATPQDRNDRWDELHAMFQSWLDLHTREEIFQVTQEEGVPGSPVLAVDEVMSDRHLEERGFFIDIPHSEAGTLTYAGPPFSLSDVSTEEPRAAPRPGQHNADVYSGLIGLSDADVSSLRQNGVI